MPVVRTHLDKAVESLIDVVTAGVPAPSGSSSAIGLIDTVERARRIASVAAVDSLAKIEATRAHYDHGHASAKVMFAHIAGVSGAQAHRLDQIRRMIAEADLIATEWHSLKLSEDKAALLGKTFANPRTRERFLHDQKWFLKRARRFNVQRLSKKLAAWTELHDHDGPEPPADPSFERRRAWLSQEHFTKSWKLDAEFGSLQGSAFNQTYLAYVEAEFAKDWAAAERTHGPETCVDLLQRTHQQRCADALCQIAADAVASDKPSAPVQREHVIVYTAEAYEEILRRWVNAPARMLDPDNYNITDIDGHPILATAAFADSLTSSLRRVIQNAAGVTINMGTPTRLFTGLARLGVKLSTTECYWPGCNVPTSRCQMDHLRPAARGGPTDQINGLPCCTRHNRLKERGYTVARKPDGTIKITTPTGDHVH